VLLGVVDEGLGAVAALEEEGLAAGDLAEASLQQVDLGGDGDRRDALQQRPDALDDVGLGPGRLLGGGARERVAEGRRERGGQRGKLGSALTGTSTVQFTPPKLEPPGSGRRMALDRERR
jgi:hypothetical protein